MEEQALYSPTEDHLKAIPGRPILLDCPSCNHFISSDEIDINQGTAVCSNCGHNFPFEHQLKRDPYRRPEMIIPTSVETLRLESMLEIVVDWYRSSAKKTVSNLISGAFLWNLVVLPLILILAMQGNYLFAIMFAGHVITGLFLLVQLLAIFMNKTRIIVDKKGIEIRHTPIPNLLSRSQYIAISNIRQLYVVRYTQKYDPKDKKGIQAYALFVILNNNKRVELLRGMNRDSQLYLEQEIETYLGIRDELVDGEVLRETT